MVKYGLSLKNSFLILCITCYYWGLSNFIQLMLQHSFSPNDRNIGSMIFDNSILIFIFYIKVQLVIYLILLYKIIIVIFSENILYKLVFWSSSWILMFLTCIVWEARNGIFQQIQVKKKILIKGLPSVNAHPPINNHKSYSCLFPLIKHAM